MLVPLVVLPLQPKKVKLTGRLESKGHIAWMMLPHACSTDKGTQQADPIFCAMAKVK